MQFAAIVHGGAQLYGPASLPGSNGQHPTFDTDGTFAAWVTVGGVSEGAAYSGGTSGGILYVDASGNLATDGPTIDASSNLTTTGRIVTDSGSTPSTGGESLQIEGTTATLAEFYRRGGGTNSTVVFRGGSSFCHVGVNSTGFAIGASSNLSTNWFHIDATTGYVSSGPITATAPAITDTPLAVNGTAGQTAALATFGTGAKITAAEEFSNSGSAAGSESFGDGASCTAADGLAVGPDASSNGVEATAVGADSLAHPYATAVGSLARCTAGSNWNASKTAVGYGTYADHTHTIVIGAISASTASYQFVAGSYAARIRDVYFGTGVSYATPDSTTFHGTGGDGTDIAGAGISIAGGIGTGTGAGGSVELKTAAAGSTGSTANTLATRMKIDGEGAITFPGIPTSDPGVTGVLWSDSGTLKLSP